MKFKDIFRENDYVIRIREDKRDLIYYDGFKVFEMDRKENIYIVPNILTLNDKNYNNPSFIGNLKEKYRELSFYCNIEINKTIEVVLSKKLKKHIKKNPTISIEEYKEEARRIEQEYVVKYKEYNNKNVEKLVELQQFIIFKTSGNKIFNSKVVKFLKTKIEVKFKIKDYNRINEIKIIMEDFCKKYKMVSKELFEKSFQHSLMTSELPIPLEGSYKFEEEYGIGKSGRIDNILIKDNKLVFIEAKVDVNVILGTNGIHKHLDDMYKWISDNEIKKIFDLYNYRVDKLKDGNPINDTSFETTYILLFAHNINTCEDIKNIVNKNNEYKDYKSIKYYIEKLKEKRCKVLMYTTEWNPDNPRIINKFIELSNEELKEVKGYDD